MNQQAKYRQNEWDAAKEDARQKEVIKRAGRTAIKRKNPSVPLRWLIEKQHIKTSDWIYDYGCGRGDDVRILDKAGYVTMSHDPNHAPKRWTDINNDVAISDIVLCTYVLNSVDEAVQDEIMRDIRRNLKDDAVAYITVRRDIKTEGINKRGTYQRNVVLNMPVVRETSTYCIYKMEKE